MPAEQRKLQDAALITAAFEHGAHFSNNEKAVFATQSRGIQTDKAFAATTEKSLGGYKGKLLEGEQAIRKTKEDILSNKAVSIARECLPCVDRIFDSVTLLPTLQFLSLLEEDIKARIEHLKNIGDILGGQSLDTYLDLCTLLHFLNGMCVLDLQQLLFLLSLLNMDFSIDLDGLIPMLRSLIAPLLAAPLANLNSILDQLITLVVAPLDCIIEALNLTIANLDVLRVASDQVVAVPNDFVARWNDLKRAGSHLSNAATAGDIKKAEKELSVATRAFNKAAKIHGPVQTTFLKSRREIQGRGDITNGLVELRRSLLLSRNKLEQKLIFYRNAAAKLLRNWSTMDQTYVQFSVNKLINIRLIGLITALIKAKTEGKPLCPDNTQEPTDEQMNIFFDTYVNPNTDYQINIDDTGAVTVTEITKPLSRPTVMTAPLPNLPKVLGLSENDPVVRAIAAPITLKGNCRLRTTAADANRVNQWIRELNSTTSN